MGRTRHRDSLGYTRPVPLMLGLRIRLTPRWLLRRHPAWLALAVTAAAVTVTMLAGHSRQAPCHQVPVPHSVVCR